MKKGFTLIELLAVIVILAIISAISIPVTLSTIDTARKNSVKRSMENIDYAAKLYYSKVKMNDNFEEFTGITFTCMDGVCSNKDSATILGLDAKGIDSGSIAISKEGVISYIDIIISGYNCNMENDKPVCTIKKEDTRPTDSLETTDSKIEILQNNTTLKNYRIYGSSSGVGDKVDENYVVTITIRGKNLFNNKNLLQTTDKYVIWEITETGIKQSKQDSYTNGYISKELYNITNIMKPNKKYYIHRDINKNFTSSGTQSEKLSGSMRLKVDGNVVVAGDVYSYETSKEYTTPSTFESILITTHTVVQDASIKDFDENTSYYFEWSNMYISTEPYTKYEPYVEPKIYTINLSSPLMENEYIDFETKSIVRNNGTIENISIPELTTLDVTTMMELETTNKPSKIEVTYYKN